MKTILFRLVNLLIILILVFLPVRSSFAVVDNGIKKDVDVINDNNVNGNNNAGDSSTESGPALEKTESSSPEQSGPLSQSELAPENTEITSVDINYRPGYSEFNIIQINTNVPVSAAAFWITSILFNNEDWAKIKNGGKLKELDSWDTTMSTGWENREAQQFDLVLTKESDPSKGNVLGRLLLIGLKTPAGLKPTNPLLLFWDRHWEKLPIPPLGDVYTGTNYLGKAAICDSQNLTFLCNLANQFIGKSDLSFSTNFAKNNPLLYVFLLALSFLLTIIIYLFLLISYFLTFIFQRNPWGVVFDAKTLQPIEGAIIRIFDKEKNKLLETKVTGKDGRFGFLPGAGDFYIRVIKPGYLFPSKILSNFHYPAYYHLYHGEEVLIKTGNAMFITNIPLDPQHRPSLAVKPFFAQRIFFGLARARWGLIVAFMLMLLINIVVIKIQGIDFIPINWIFVSLLPIILLEFYFFWQGKRVKIVKKSSS